MIDKLRQQEQALQDEYLKHTARAELTLRELAKVQYAIKVLNDTEDVPGRDPNDDDQPTG